MFEGADDGGIVAERPCKRPRWAKWVWLGLVTPLLLIALYGLAHAQQTVPDWVVGGIYNSSAPTVGNKQRAPFQTDVNGNLKVNCITGCSGGGGGGGTSSNFGAAFPTAGTAAGFKNAGGNMDWGLVDASHSLNVSVVTSALPTGAALDSSLQSILTALGSPMQQTGGSVSIVAGSALIGKVAIDQTTPGTTNGVQVNAALPAGTAILGKVGIDQTTPGTTNGVQVNAALPAGSAIIGNVRIDQTTPGTTNGVQVNAALPAGSAIIGNFRIDQTTPGTTNGVALEQIGSATVLAGAGAVGTGSARVAVGQDTTTIAGAAPGTAGTASANVISVQGVASMTPVQTQNVGATTGGLSAYFVQPTASDNHAVIKAGAGTVYSIMAFNNSATVNYLRLYNATTGFNGCNSATNLITQTQIPASTSATGFVINLGIGLAFSTGISICVTSGYATTDTTNATASAMSVTVGYQ